jgi:hypothetical protein
MPHLLKNGSDAERAAWFAYYQTMSGYRSIVDDIKAGMAWRDAQARGCQEMALEVWKRRRAERLEWFTVTQRKWQGNTRRPSRARHHDSVSIREKYVRCLP